MKTLIVGRTRQGGGACVGGITFEGRSVRLMAPPEADERWGLEFEVGFVWEIEGEPPDCLIPPHTENIVVRSRRRLSPMSRPAQFIERHMPAWVGGPSGLYGGLLNLRPSGALYISESTGVPQYSTTFWRPDRPLARVLGGKRIRYQYSYPDSSGRYPSFAYVGFQEPIPEIPAGTLVRISLAHWWTPPDNPDEEPRCFAQLSGWFDSPLPASTNHAAGLAVSTPLMPALVDASAARSASGMGEAKQILSRIFGYEAFRPFQEDIVASVLRGRDTLGIMPTGAGKSLCFQVPALLSKGVTVVVSPLISLMQDQVDQLRAHGVAAVALNSALSHAEYAAASRQIREGTTRILYVAPETLIRPEIGVLLDGRGVNLLTIDEAHCISEWGHDFRPEYRQIRSVRARYPNAVCLAITATATDRVRSDIRTVLGISEENTFVAPFDRPNLYLEVRRRSNGLRQIMEYLAGRNGQPGVIYCATRDQVDMVAAGLKRNGIEALPYHAGMDDGLRKASQRRFHWDDVPIIVATIAFGMGINKSNVRFVVHYALPDSLETYYQQVGRAGRDGLRSDCLLLFDRSDIATARHFIDGGPPAEQPGRTARLHAMSRYAESSVCRRKPLLTYFGDPAPEQHCAMCDNCEADGSGRTPADVSEDARLILHCIKQTRQGFGAVHVVDVLRGSQASKIVKTNHNLLPIHGKGRHKAAPEWRHLVDRLIEAGAIEAEMEHGTLRITLTGRSVMSGEPIRVILNESLPPRHTARFGGDSTHDPLLFERLRQLRKKLADESNVPAFVIFSDRVLTEMAAACPQTVEEFRRIGGVGDFKTEKYSEAFLEVLRQFAVEPEVPAETMKRDVGGRSVEIAEAFVSGQSVQQIQDHFGVTRGTVLQHLLNYARGGGRLDTNRILGECSLAKEEQNRALEQLDSLGHDRLKPVFDALGGEVPYSELYVLRIYRICSKLGK